jgi:DUF4097 and DUF4098 domain-containing protein YvlB
MKRMKTAKTAILGISLLLLFALSASAFAAREKYEEKFEKTVTLAKQGKVDLRNISGNIEVKTWGQDQVKIQALKVSEASSSSKAKENADKVSIEVAEEGNVLRIATKYPKNDKLRRGESINVSVNYWLWIPDQASLEVNSISGDVMAEGPGGPVDLSSISGEVRLSKASKGADCKTISGNLEITGVTGDAFLKSVSGNITASQVKGSIQAETVSGDLDLSQVSEASVVRLKSLSGSVVYRGSINRAGTYNLKSHSGEIEMILPANSAFDFEAQSFSGSINSDFEIKMTGKIAPREMSGVVNGGGATVKISTFSGDIKLKKG